MSNMSIRAGKDGLILVYSPKDGVRWIDEEFSKGQSINPKRIFKFSKQDLICANSDGVEIYDENKDLEPEDYETAFDDEVGKRYAEFNIGSIDGDYYLLKKSVFNIKHSIYIHKSINIKINMFVSIGNFSIIKQIDDLLKSSLYIGGDKEPLLPERAFHSAILSLPNELEVKRYITSRLSGILKDSIDNVFDANASLEKILARKAPAKHSDIFKKYSAIELDKYTEIHSKLVNMLDNSANVSEKAWQAELIKVLLLLYPKYIAAIPEATIRDCESGNQRRIDYMLIDSCGHIDIVEIKKPHGHYCLSNSQYRKNYIASHDLSGTVMQVEKYLYNLNKSGKSAEAILTKKYTKLIPDEIDIKITNPRGMIFFGRSNDFDSDQARDFEIIKRKYKNIADIITYDDLLDRLRRTIALFTKQSAELPASP